MSVLDRALVKAYERHRISAAAAQSAAEPRRDTAQESPGSAAALHMVDTVTALVAEEEVADVSPQRLHGTDVAWPTGIPRESPVDSLEAAITALAVTESPVTPEFDTVTEEPTPPRHESIPTSEPTVASTASEPVAATVATTAPPPVIAESVAATAPENVSGLPSLVAWKWPEICEQLDQFTGDGFRQLAKHLQFAAGQGHKVLAFVSSTGNTGRTSVLLTLTRILALEGRTDTLLIDADRRHPDLASLTGLNPAIGLTEVLHGQATLEEATVRRTPGQIALLPQRTVVSDVEWSKVISPLRAMVKQARQDYDMILIDAGVFGPETRLSDCWLRGAADAVITISRQLNGQNNAHEVLNWKQIGIESLGVIETFS